MSVGAIIFTLLIVGSVFFAITIYNRLVTLKNRHENAFSQIEVQLKRRYDLIPNLVETAKGYMAHERETLEAVIAARNEAATLLKGAAATLSGDAMQQLAGAEGVLQGALSKLNVVMEAYPELKANENMMQLSEELTTTENRVAFARQSFNDAVTNYNAYRQSFPVNMLCNSFGHRQDASLLEFADSAEIQKAPQISF